MQSFLFPLHAHGVIFCEMVSTNKVQNFCFNYIAFHCSHVCKKSSMQTLVQGSQSICCYWVKLCYTKRIIHSFNQKLHIVTNIYMYIYRKHHNPKQTQTKSGLRKTYFFLYLLWTTAQFQFLSYHLHCLFLATCDKQKHIVLLLMECQYELRLETSWQTV